MTNTPPTENRRRDLPFFGRIAAGISHDIRNVLSIIHQYAGLLEDITLAAKGGSSVEPEKILEISSDIRRQVKKGADILGRFSRFAHATDERVDPHDLTELVENMSALAERHVTQAACRMEIDLADEFVDVPILVHADPFGLQYTIFTAIELLLQFLDSGRLITVKVEDCDANAAISISADPGDTTDMAEFTQRASHLLAVGNELDVRVEISSPDETVIVRLLVPKS